MRREAGRSSLLPRWINHVVKDKEHEVISAMELQTAEVMSVNCDLLLPNKKILLFIYNLQSAVPKSRFRFWSAQEQ